MPVTSSVFDKVNNITLYTISNQSQRLSAKIIDYGATIVGLLTPDRTGVVRDIVLGFDDLDGYQSKRIRNPYFGASVGRVANRIADANFELNGQNYSLPVNSGTLTIHGGPQGFDKQKWALVEQGDCFVVLGYTSVDGEMGFPGQVEVRIKFEVTAIDELSLEYSAVLTPTGSVESTIINLTNHSYFNLNGAHTVESSKILDHEVLMFGVENYLEVDERLIPTGNFLPCKGSNFDFLEKPRTIGERTQKIAPAGYDHCFVLETDETCYEIAPSKLRKAVQVYAPQSGIRMTLSTTEPGVQLYAGSKILEGHRPKSSQTVDQGVVLGSYSGFCLEAQRFPDAIHRENWLKQVVLKKGESYRQKTVFKLATV